VYPYGSLFSHVVGCSDVDSIGVSGIERSFNDKLIKQEISLTLDLRIQTIVYEELKAAIEKFKAIGGNAIIINVTGEIIAMISFPDFDPNNIRQEEMNFMFNRNTLGMYEPGSTFKILNIAIALESGSATLNSKFDATNPVTIGKFTITDFKGKHRTLSLAEAFVFSSNIAATKIAQQFGIRTQKKYMKKFGILDKINLEIQEVGMPIIPQIWGEATLMTMSYGYGIAVSPLQLATAVASIVNGGNKVYPTLVLNNVRSSVEKVVSENTSTIIRDLMRAAVCYGTAKKAGVDGIEIFGKTGTAYKRSGKGYGSDGSRSRISTFVGGFPKNNPQYIIVLMLDDPKPVDGTFGYATAGWNAAPAAGKIFKRIIPVLCSYKSVHIENEEELIVTKYIHLK
jgi:cell division protein FtsI (penicillin-binding protein 3)